MLMVGVLGGIFTGMALMICKPMAEAEVEWFYFALMGLTAISAMPVNIPTSTPTISITNNTTYAAVALYEYALFFFAL